MRTQTYLFLQKLKCPKCGRILVGGAIHKLKSDKWYFYYRCEDCKNNIKEKDNEISFLKSKIKDIQNTLEYWKDKFEKLISFLHDKLHSWYDKDDFER